MALHSVALGAGTPCKLWRQPIGHGPAACERRVIDMSFANRIQERAKTRGRARKISSLELPLLVVLSNQWDWSCLISPAVGLERDFVRVGAKMPRMYQCKACHTTHAAPTGKGCQKAATAMHEEQAGDQSQAVMSVLMGLQKQMAEMQVEFQQMRAEKDNVEESEQGSEVEEREATQEETDEGATAAMPNSIRYDIRLIAKAAERLNRLSVDELEEEEGQDINSSRTRGKKSGSVMLASDIVKKQIDWPNLHVTHMVQGSQKPVPYKELKVEEFVYGFIELLRAPNNKLDLLGMIDILSMIMQDTVDFTWNNARGFYEKVGLDVEKAGLAWTDMNRINGMRLIYSRGKRQ